MSFVPQFALHLLGGGGLPLTQPFNVRFQMGGPASMYHIVEFEFGGLRCRSKTFGAQLTSNVPLVARPETDRETLHSKGDKQPLCGLTSTSVLNVSRFEFVKGNAITVVAPPVHQDFIRNRLSWSLAPELPRATAPIEYPSVHLDVKKMAGVTRTFFPVIRWSTRIV